MDCPQCPHLEVRHFDIAAPDMDDDDPAYAIATAYPFACCKRWQEECRYLVGLAAQPWHAFDVVPLCTGWIVTDGKAGELPVEIAPILADETWLWPGAPPSQQQPDPSRQELVDFASRLLLSDELRAEAERIAARRGYGRAVDHIATALHDVVKQPEYGPAVFCKDGKLTVYVQAGERPALHLSIKDFIRRVFTVESAQADQLALF